MRYREKVFCKFNEMLNIVVSIVGFILFLVAPVPSSIAADAPFDIQEMATSSKTVDGDSFNYPTGNGEMRLVRAEFQKGATFPMHTHPVPLMAYVETGELTLTREDGSSETFKQDDTFIAGPNTPPHTMGNTGGDTAVMWITFTAAEGVPNLELVE